MSYYIFEDRNGVKSQVAVPIFALRVNRKGAFEIQTFLRYPFEEINEGAMFGPAVEVADKLTLLEQRKDKDGLLFLHAEFGGESTQLT